MPPARVMFIRSRFFCSSVAVMFPVRAMVSGLNFTLMVTWSVIPITAVNTSNTLAIRSFIRKLALRNGSVHTFLKQTRWNFLQCACIFRFSLFFDQQPQDRLPVVWWCHLSSLYRLQHFKDSANCGNRRPISSAAVIHNLFSRYRNENYMNLTCGIFALHVYRLTSMEYCRELCITKRS